MAGVAGGTLPRQRPFAGIRKRSDQPDTSPGAPFRGSGRAAGYAAGRRPPVRQRRRVAWWRCVSCA